MIPSYITQTENSLTLSVTITANAKNNKLHGNFNNALKIFISSPAIEGKANKMLITFLAKEFKLRKNQIDILSGETSHHKKIKLSSLSSDAITYILKKLTDL